MKYSDTLMKCAFDIYKMHPWREIGDNQIIAFHSEIIDEIMYVNYMGRMGEHLAVAAYFGEDGLQSLFALMVHNSDIHYDQKIMPPDVMYALAGQNCAQISFLSTEDAYEDQLSDTLQYAAKNGERIRGKKDIPSFVDFRPQFQPFTLVDETRLKVLGEAMDLTLYYGRKHHRDFTGLPIASTDEPSLIPYFQMKNGQWEESKMLIHGYNEEICWPSVKVENQVLIHKLKKLPQRGSMDVEMRIGPLLDWNKSSNSAYYPDILLSYLQEEEYICQPVLMDRSVDEHNLDVWPRILDTFLTKTILNQTKRIPETIYYYGARTGVLLEKFCDQFDIELVEKDSMPEMEELLESMDSLEKLDDEGYSIEFEKMMKPMIESMKRMSRAELKMIPEDIKEQFRDVPEEALRPELYRELQEIIKCF